MSKVYLNELAGMLAKKHDIDRRTAYRFVNSIVSVIQKGVENDRLVKIKGLGTFKIIDVDARESVNVNTGERLVIEGHPKLTFLPDASMKELVNKPFSMFETVMLNDGVAFDDMMAETEVEESSEVKEDCAEEDLIVSLLEEEEPQPVEDEPVEEEEEPQPVVEEPVEEEEEPQPVVEQPEEEEEEPQPRMSQPFMEEYYIEELRKSNRKWLLALVIALVIGFAVGYFLGRQSKSIHVPVITIEDNSEEVTPQEEPSDTLQIQAEEQPVKQENLEKQPLKQEDLGKKKEPEPTAAKTSDDTPEWEKYNNMDMRLREGYYYIMGLDRIEKAREGDNSKRIAKRVFGAVEMACYIEVYNGMNASTVLKAGTDIKVPKIASKKSVRKKLQQQNNN